MILNTTDVFIPKIVKGKLIMEFVEIAWYIGFLPLTIFLMIIIGWATPADIVKITIETPKPTIEVYRAAVVLDIIFGIVLCLAGIPLAIADTVIANNGNYRGFSLLSFGLMLFSYAFVMIQAWRNGKFIENLRKFFNLNLKISNSIQNYDQSEKLLYFSRILLIIGCEICVIGCAILFLDNYPVNIGQIRSIAMISIGFAVMVFAGSFERYAINEMFQSLICEKIKCESSSNVYPP